MGRPRRTEIPGAYYHVVTRGNDRGRIYFGNWSGRLFLRELERASLHYGWRVLAYCLMTNHYHLLIRISDGGLSRGMCEFNGRFAQISNWVNGRSDHLFGRRFRDRLIESDEHLLEACRYVVLNPIRATTGCPDPRCWRWSSLGPTLGLTHPPACLDVGWVLGHFGRDRHVPGRSSRRSSTRAGSGRRCQAPIRERHESRTNDAQHPVALALHLLLRARFEVQAQERLRVRGPDVEMPVVRIDRQTVEV
jgi:putative transposase